VQVIAESIDGALIRLPRMTALSASFDHGRSGRDMAAYGFKYLTMINELQFNDQ
jgi:hypothetical protein